MNLAVGLVVNPDQAVDVDDRRSIVGRVALDVRQARSEPWPASKPCGTSESRWSPTDSSLLRLPKSENWLDPTPKS